MDNEPKLILCPYCGHTQTAETRCEQCGGLFEQLSRKATQIAMGPWFVRDPNRPFRPGCSYDVLVKQIKAGKIKPTAILRGPTTRQFWSVARNVPGVAHLLGYCHRCGAHVEPGPSGGGGGCPSCGEPFQAPPERNELGLAYATDAAAEAAQRALDKEIAEQHAGQSGGGGGGLPAGRVPQGSSQSLGQAFGFSIPPVGGTAAGAAGSDTARASSAPAESPAPPLGADLLREVLGTLPPAPPAPPLGRGSATAVPADRGRGRSRGRPHTGPMPPTVPAAGARMAPADVPAGAEPPSESPGMADQLKKLGLTTWLLIAAVVVVGVILVLVVIQMLTQNQNPTSNPPSTPPPRRQPTTSPAAAPANPRPAVGSESRGGDFTKPHPVESPAPVPAPPSGPPLATDAGTGAPPARSNPSPAPRDPTANTPNPPDVGSPAIKPAPLVKPPADPWMTAMAEVDDLEIAGKFVAAKDKLKAMKDLAGADAIKLKTIKDKIEDLNAKMKNPRSSLFPVPPQP